MTWLCNKSVSETNQTLGKSAGYFSKKRLKVFLRSVDGLLGQEPKLKLYNETLDVNGNIPEGYDQKILDLGRIVIRMSRGSCKWVFLPEQFYLIHSHVTMR